MTHRLSEGELMERDMGKIEAEMSEFTHINAEGRAKMVDVGGKAFTDRTAVARARSSCSRRPLKRLNRAP